MPSPRPLSSSSNGSGSSPPPRPPETPTEILYNTAVQSFVRRDHLKTHASLSRLLSNLKGQSRKQARKRWHDLSPATSSNTRAVHGANGVAVGATAEGELDVEEWLIKTFKLYISAHASLFTDPPQSSLSGPSSSNNGGATTPGLPPDLLALIPPEPPSVVLEHVTNTALQAYPDGILPPPVLSTLILASLKLQPGDDALAYVHRITEDWLANLPGAFIDGISRPAESGTGAATGKRIEAGREGYAKVLELFTGEVLAREGEWEMARGILDGDTLLGSKRKEALYRHLRATQARREAPSSASSSGILPSPSSSIILPSGNSSSVTPQTRSRASSASSSEATARPTSQILRPTTSSATATGTGTSRREAPIFRHPLDNAGTDKGKGKAESVTTTSESTLPSRIVVNPPGRGGTRQGGRDASGRNSGPPGLAAIIRRRLLSMLNFGFLPAGVRNRLWGLSTIQLMSLILPVPLLAVLFLHHTIRRRRRTGLLGSAGAGPVVTTTTGNRIEQVRARLLAARRRGIWAWFIWCLQWWRGKVAGVWKLGTTITYV